MADLRVFISVPTRHLQVNSTVPNASDGHRGISQAEARRALQEIDTFKSQHSEVQDNEIQVRLEGINANVNGLRRIAGVQTPVSSPAPTAPAPTPAPPTPPVQETVNMNAETVTGTGNTPPAPPVTPNNLSTEAPRVNLPAPSGPTVSPNGVNFRVSVAPATIRGLEGATLWNTTAILNFNRILTLGSAGSLRLNLGVGGILNQGDGNLLASNGGPAASVGLEAELGRPGTFSALLGFNGLAALLFGRSEVPGQAYWTGLDQGGTVGLQGCLGYRYYVSPGTSIDGCWTPTIIHTPNGVRDVAGNAEHLTATSLSGFSLGLTHHSLPTLVAIQGATVCAEVGRTPESMRARIEALRPQIASLRQENDRLRTEIHARYPNLNLASIAGLETITDSNNDETRAIPTDCDDLSNLLNTLENRANQLAEQNARLDGIRYGLGAATPAAAVPTATRAITRLQEIHFATSRPQGLPDRVTDVRANIATIESAVQNYLNNHAVNSDGTRTPLTVNEIEDLFRGIFVRTRRSTPLPATGDAGAPDLEYAPSIEVIQHIAEDLKSGDLRNLDFYIVGNTDTRGDEAMNGRLSLRRAAAIRDALILFGVNPERLHPIGRGENNTIYYYDQTPGAGRRDPHTITQPEITMLRRDGIQGPLFRDEVALRGVTNRRVEMYICDPQNTNDIVCNTLRGEYQTANPSDAGVAPTARPISTMPADGGGTSPDASTPMADASVPNA